MKFAPNWLSSSRFKSSLRDLLNKTGWDLRRAHNSPRVALLGLRHKPFKTVIDVGANEGQFAQRYSAIFPQAKFFCFEPLPGPFRKLDAWAHKQHGRVLAKNVALGAEEGQVEMRLHSQHTASSSILATTDLAAQVYPQTQDQTIVQVKQTTLDTALQEHKFDDDVLVKMDVQGYEDRVVAGGEATLSRATACITEISLDHLYQNQATLGSLLSLLKDCGLEYAGNLEQIYAGDGHCIYLDALFVRRQ